MSHLVCWIWTTVQLALCTVSPSLANQTLRLITCFFFCVCLQVVTSPRLEWTSRSGQWWSMGRRWSCRSGIRQDRSASAPSPPREYRQGWITHTRNNTHTHGELQYFFTRPTFMIVWASTSQRLESFPCSFWNLMGFPTDLNYTF